VRIRLAIKIIEEQLGDFGSTLKTTTELLGLSQTRFRHLFKLEIGKAWSQYLREAKMAGAAQSMKRYAVPIKEIAQQCGYDDLSNFYRDFRRVHGMTPQQLRAHHLDLLYQSKKLVSGAAAGQ
jgi:AraC-like DNA-binding protein